MLICYSIVGFIVYVTLLLLGEMATQYPIAGECFSVFLAMFAEERSCASITPVSGFLAGTYKCTESPELLN
jgi:AAT family amino acid transporter